MSFNSQHWLVQLNPPRDSWWTRAADHGSLRTLVEENRVRMSNSKYGLATNLLHAEWVATRRVFKGNKDE